MSNKSFTWKMLGNVDVDDLTGMAKDGVVLVNSHNSDASVNPDAMDYASTVYNILGSAIAFLEANEKTIETLLGKDSWKVNSHLALAGKTMKISETIHNFVTGALEVRESLKTDQRNAGPEDPSYISSQTYQKVSSLTIDILSFFADCVGLIPGPVGVAAKTLGVAFNFIAIFQSTMSSEYDAQFKILGESIKNNFGDYEMDVEVLFASTMTEKYKSGDTWGEIFPTVKWFLNKLDIPRFQGTQYAKELMQIFSASTVADNPGLFTLGSIGRESLSFLDKISRLFGLGPIEVPKADGDYIGLSTDVMIALDKSQKILDKSITWILLRSAIV